MPLDLAQNRGPLDETDPSYHDVLDEIQGNILAGHGRSNAVHLFVHFEQGKEAAARQFLSQFSRRYVRSALEQVQAAEKYRSEGADAGIFGHVSLSASGYGYLGITGSGVPRGTNHRSRDVQDNLYQDVFAQGMASRGDVLLDPKPAEWEPGFGEAPTPIHALLILAADDPAELISNERSVLTSLNSAGLLLTSERGLNIKRRFSPSDPPQGFGIEHFGYVDGRSQPIFLKRQVDLELAGGTASFWDPRAPLQILLVPDPNGTPFISFGSFLVFRKLEQNVRAFRKAEQDLAQELGLPRELVGAMAVGRFKDGTPVILQPGDGARPIPNDFNYGGDPSGLVCPFQAHIRKTNPRLESVRAGGPFAGSAEEELGHRIARRGIPYGGPFSDGNNPDDLPEKGVGLLFMCYQADIWEQFEFIQRFWANNSDFLEPGFGGAGAQNFPATGLDAVIGQARGQDRDPILNKVPEPPKIWPSAWGKQPAPVPTTNFAQFVSLKGGEYFFSPCVSFLKSL